MTPSRQLGWTRHRAPLTPAPRSLSDLLRERGQARVRPAPGTDTTKAQTYRPASQAPPQRDAKPSPQAMRSEPSRCTRPYGAPRRQAKRAGKEDPCLSIALPRAHASLESRPLCLP
ncbi:lactate utilization protein LutB domain-containing protein [Cupriavidus basilensis]